MLTTAAAIIHSVYCVIMRKKYDYVKYISFSRNFGKEAAMLAGMKMSDAEYVGILDADLQHSPNLIPDMINVLINEDYDIAAARRIDRKGEAKLKSVFSKQFINLSIKFRTQVLRTARRISE